MARALTLAMLPLLTLLPAPLPLPVSLLVPIPGLGDVTGVTLLLLLLPDGTVLPPEEGREAARARSSATCWRTLAQ